MQNRPSFFISMDESQKKQAWISSLRLLAASPKTRRELAGKLADKGYAELVIKETLDRLEKQGVLSDKAYAENLLNRFAEIQPSGKRKIAFEMKRRGVPAKIQEEVLNRVGAGEELARAKELAIGRWERFGNLDREKRKKRVYDFLIRRGFDYQLSRDLVEAFATGEHHA